MRMFGACDGVCMCMYLIKIFLFNQINLYIFQARIKETEIERDKVMMNIGELTNLEKREDISIRFSYDVY